MFIVDGKEFCVPEWFANKKLINDGERYAWHNGDGQYLKRETEKAVLVCQNSDFGVVSLWCPKSVLVSKEQAQRQVEEHEKALENGLRYNKYLYDIAKESGVKIGNAKRTVLIADKLAAAGVKFMSKEEFLAA